ncbi:MAG TPA: DUF6677 family protein [Terriglobales bacterium]
MAKETKTTTAPVVEEKQYPPNALSIAALFVGWIVPGAGHLLVRRWVRGVLIMISVFTMFFLGLAMQGKVYDTGFNDLIDVLSFVGDLCTGGLYILARSFDWGAGAIHRAVADYGTKFIVVAGLLNVISMIDAYHIAIGKKQ